MNASSHQSFSFKKTRGVQLRAAAGWSRDCVSGLPGNHPSALRPSAPLIGAGWKGAWLSLRPWPTRRNVLTSHRTPSPRARGCIPPAAAALGSPSEGRALSGWAVSLPRPGVRSRPGAARRVPAAAMDLHLHRADYVQVTPRGRGGAAPGGGPLREAALGPPLPRRCAGAGPVATAGRALPSGRPPPGQLRLVRDGPRRLGRTPAPRAPTRPPIPLTPSPRLPVPSPGAPLRPDRSRVPIPMHIRMVLGRRRVRGLGQRAGPGCTCGRSPARALCWAPPPAPARLPLAPRPALLIKLNASGIGPISVSIAHRCSGTRNSLRIGLPASSLQPHVPS